MVETILQYIRRQALLPPGTRVALAVSGGADSVCLLRVVLELRQELGIVACVAHFHHGIRGAEADADREFVRYLASHFGLEFHTAAADVPAFARSHKFSLETAARDLRHQWFAQIVSQGTVDKVATAHTLDDQAETVLMRLVRGAGSRGLAGIFPVQQERNLVRPLLTVTRREVETYLRTIGQAWREDSTNRDLRHTRNRIRHELLPLLERDFNPAIRHTLAELAEVARAEGDYWHSEATSFLQRSLAPSNVKSRSLKGFTLDLAALAALPLAMQRQVLSEAGGQAGIALEFQHIQQLTDLIAKKSGSKQLVLPRGLKVVRSSHDLRFIEARASTSSPEYRYRLHVPGEVAVPELGALIRARLVSPDPQDGEYNSFTLLDRALIAPELIVRNWRPGDRFFPAQTRTPKKVKELLQAGRLGRQISTEQRKAWPVAESSGQVVWMRGFAVPKALTPRVDKCQDAVLIEEYDLVSGRRNER